MLALLLLMEVSFVALGDSFTEGLDDRYPDGGYRGWADRLAQLMAEDGMETRYANLAVRGRVLSEVMRDQLPAAIAMRPDLVSIAAGGNDLLWPGGDPDTLAEQFDLAVVRLREAGCRVLIFTGFDPLVFPVIRLVRGKAAAYNMHLRGIADQRGCDLVDMWSMRVLRHPAAWSVDRLHLSARGHERVALRAAEVLGVAVTQDWREPFPPVTPPTWAQARRADLAWAREFALPWVNRRIRGISSGDGVPAKLPELREVRPAASQAPA
jgi:lysophospholipase L1-like esterase